MESTITPFVTGDFTLPPDHRLAGNRVVTVAYLIGHPEAIVLLDTGFPFDAPSDVMEGEDGAKVTTYPRSLTRALAAAGTPLDRVDLVLNCHLHIDHAGGNFRLPAHLPIYVQDREYTDALTAAAEEPIVRDALALDAKDYRRLHGETEILPGLTVVPTPGHTPGHQSLVVATSAGPVLLGGQSMASASDFALAMYARRLESEAGKPLPPYPAWLPDTERFGPSRAMFAHDLAVWTRDGRI